MKKTLSILLISASLLYGFWPMSSGDYPISWSSDAISKKRMYLQRQSELQIHSDTTDRPPNIIIILADDLSYMDVSAYGGKHVKTTHIDQLAINGVRFTNAFVSSPICAPSRAGLLTGKYQQRFGFEINIHERYPRNRIEHFVYKNFIAKGDWKVDEPPSMRVPNEEDMRKQGLDPSEILLSDFLKANHYSTACFGKWHLGYDSLLQPNQLGFDHHYGFYEAYSLYAPIDQDTIINQKLNDFSDPFLWKKGRSGNCAIRVNDSIIQDDTYITQQIAHRSTDWIKEHVEDPFLLYVPFSAPHTPFQATQYHYDLYAHVKDPKKRIYYAMIHALDDAVGHIIQTLDDLALSENTLVFFLSDNGGATYTEAADNRPLVGGKMTQFEGGIRVPFIMNWKNRIPDSTLIESNISSLDIFKTICSILSIDDDHTQSLDGLDLMTLIDNGTDPNFDNRSLFWRAGGQKAVRKGSWKMIWDDIGGGEVLYDMSNPNPESKNVLLENESIRKELRQEYNKWEKDMTPSRWPNVMYYQFIHQNDTFCFPL